MTATLTIEVWQPDLTPSHVAKLVHDFNADAARVLALAAELDGDGGSVTSIEARERGPSSLIIEYKGHSSAMRAAAYSYMQGHLTASGLADRPPPSFTVCILETIEPTSEGVDL